MSGTQQQFYNVLAPREGEITVIAVSAASTSTDLSLIAELGEAAAAGRFIEFHADGEDIFWFMAATGSSTAAVAATSGLTQTMRLGNGERAQYKLPQGAMFLTMIGSLGTGKIRLAMVSDVQGASQS